MASETRLKIEQVAKESGLTKRTIRFYEDIGILPTPERSEGGTRWYKAEHVDVLNRITRIKEAMGFSLQEIQKFISLSGSLDNYRVDYKNSSDKLKKKEKLIEIIHTIDEQLQLIDDRIKKVRNTQKEFLSMKQRAEDALQKINEGI